MAPFANDSVEDAMAQSLRHDLLLPACQGSVGHLEAGGSRPPVDCPTSLVQVDRPKCQGWIRGEHPQVADVRNDTMLVEHRNTGVGRLKMRLRDDSGARFTGGQGREVPFGETWSEARVARLLLVHWF